MKTVKELFNEYKTDSINHAHYHDWFGHYKDFYERIHKCSSISNEMFEELLWKYENWIARYGNCVFSRANYEKLRDDAEFRQTIDDFLKDPNSIQYKKLEDLADKRCAQFGAHRIVLRIKRIACAFNSNLSLFCSGDFEKALEEAAQLGYVKSEVKKSWFDENIDFTKWLDQALGHVTGNDVYFRNIFLWEFWDKEINGNKD